MIDVIPEYLDLAQALLSLVILSLILERSLIVLFEYRWYEEYLSGKGIKTPIALLIAWFICLEFQFDVIKVLFQENDTTGVGIFLTAAVVSGGSKSAISLFEGVLGLTKEAQSERKKAVEEEARAKTKQAEANTENAKADIAEAQARIALASAQVASAHTTELQENS